MAGILIIHLSLFDVIGIFRAIPAFICASQTVRDQQRITLQRQKTRLIKNSFQDSFTYAYKLKLDVIDALEM